jgi:hypothetical protein
MGVVGQQTKPMANSYGLPTPAAMCQLMKTLHLVASCAILACSCGCATPYLHDRGRDAADILTASFGAGLGAKARVGPLQAGLLVQGDVAGLRAGTLGRLSKPDDGPFLPLTSEVILLVVGGEGLQTSDPLSGERGKDFIAGSVLPLIFLPESHDRKKSVSVPSYFTQIEGVVALGVSVRFGFNPGELVDFLLGWAGIDFYGDDVACRSPAQVSSISYASTAPAQGMHEVTTAADLSRRVER